MTGPAEAGSFRAALVQAGLGTPEEFRTYLVEQYRKSALRERTLKKLREDNKLVPVNVTNAEIEAEFQRARQLFYASIVYLPSLLVLMVCDKVK